jgi:hypothetical protein
MARKLTAEKLTENAATLIEQIAGTAQAEIRKDLAARIAELAKAPEQELTSCMDNDRRPVTDDLRAGLALAAELLADLDFDA